MSHPKGVPAFSSRIRQGTDGQMYLPIPDGVREKLGVETGARLRFRVIAKGEMLIDVVGEDYVLQEGEYEGRVIPTPEWEAEQERGRVVRKMSETLQEIVRRRGGDPAALLGLSPEDWAAIVEEPESVETDDYVHFFLLLGYDVKIQVGPKKPFTTMGGLSFEAEIEE